MTVYSVIFGGQVGFCQLVSDCVDPCIEVVSKWCPRACGVGFLIYTIFTCHHILSSHLKVVSKLKIDEKTQLEFIKRIGECHVRIVEGVSTPLQLGGLLARMCKYSREVLSTIKTV